MGTGLKELGRGKKAAIVSGAALLALALAWRWREVVARGVPLPTFLGACERIRESGIPPHPGDAWCDMPSWHPIVSAYLSIGLAALGVILGSILIAAKGRRLLTCAFLAIGMALLAFFTIDLSLVRQAIVLGLPAAALTLVTPQRQTPLIARRTRAKAALIQVPAAAFLWIGAWSLFAIGGHERPDAGIYILTALGVAALWILGAGIGWNRWTRSSLAIVALLLSLGPSVWASYVFPWSPEGQGGWTLFGLAIPLYLAGELGLRLEPLARRLAHLPRESRPRPSSVAIALVALILLGSTAMYAIDPTNNDQEIHDARSLMLLDGRNAAQDYRTLMTLDVAADAYELAAQESHGLAASALTSREPGITWTNSSDQTEGAVFPTEDERGRPILVLTSPTESVFCMSIGRPQRTIGQGRDVQEAIAGCSSESWSAPKRQPPAMPTCISETPGFLICRMVAVLMWKFVHDPIEPMEGSLAATPSPLPPTPE